MLELIGDGFRFDTLKEGTIMTRGTEGFRLHGFEPPYHLNRPKVSHLLAEELRGGALDSDGVT
ncbi:hypothetical protein [Streptomyces sp. NPDC002078]